jgi:hypothetical protein
MPEAEPRKTWNHHGREKIHEDLVLHESRLISGIIGVRIGVSELVSGGIIGVIDANSVNKMN